MLMEIIEDVMDVMDLDVLIDVIYIYIIHLEVSQKNMVKESVRSHEGASC